MNNLPINQIICGDCLDVMRDWPDGCVDLVLTDPPYGIGEDGSRNGSRSHLCRARSYPKTGWDNSIPSAEAFTALFKISSQQIVWGGNYFGDYLGASSCWLVWNKDNGKSDFADCELAWTSFNTAVRMFRWKSQGMLQEPGHPKDVRLHPTQKPLALMQWCIENYSNPEDLILDPFCGSGTTCVAAKKLGRNYIGIDISEEYCQIARERLAAVETGVPVKEARAGQMGLFEGDKR